MKWTIAIALSCLAFSSLCQISDSDKKKINKILGDGFVQGQIQESYPVKELCEGCTAELFAHRRLDTTGVFLNNEYVLFRSPISFKLNSEVFKMIKSKEVSLFEFEEFTHWVRDSIAREKLYFGLENGPACMNYDLEKNKRKLFDEDLEYVEYNSTAASAEVLKAHQPIKLNWEYKLDYNSQEFVATLADMYYPRPERLNRIRKFDQRKWHYNFIEENEDTASLIRHFPAIEGEYQPGKLNLFVPLIRDEFSWSRNGTWNFDEYAALSQLNSVVGKSEPVIGLKGFQTDAFCHWKQSNLQNEFDNAGLNYKVIVTLPTKSDLTQPITSKRAFEIPSRDYSAKWRISISDYYAFVNHVEDSIIREYLHDSLQVNLEAAKFLKGEKYYYCEGNMEYVAYDHSHRAENRHISPLNYKTKIKLNKWEVGPLVAEVNASMDSTGAVFTYSYFDCMKMVDEGVLKKRYHWWNKDYPDSTWRVVYEDSEESPMNRDLVLMMEYPSYFPSQLRSHRNLQAGMKTVQINVRPDKAGEISGESMIQNITYEQAMAYYNWIFPIQFATEESDWQDYVFPTKEQYEAVLQGERIYSVGRTIDYPSPTFRYVVHLFPKTN